MREKRISKVWELRRFMSNSLRIKLGLMMVVVLVAFTLFGGSKQAYAAAPGGLDADFAARCAASPQGVFVWVVPGNYNQAFTTDSVGHADGIMEFWGGICPTAQTDEVQRFSVTSSGASDIAICVFGVCTRSINAIPTGSCTSTGIFTMGSGAIPRDLRKDGRYELNYLGSAPFSLDGVRDSSCAYFPYTVGAISGTAVRYGSPPQRVPINWNPGSGNITANNPSVPQPRCPGDSNNGRAGQVIPNGETTATWCYTAITPQSAIYVNCSTVSGTWGGHPNEAVNVFFTSAGGNSYGNVSATTDAGGNFVQAITNAASTGTESFYAQISGTGITTTANAGPCASTTNPCTGLCGTIPQTCQGIPVLGGGIVAVSSYCWTIERLDPVVCSNSNAVVTGELTSGANYQIQYDTIQPDGTYNGPLTTSLMPTSGRLYVDGVLITTVYGAFSETLPQRFNDGIVHTIRVISYTGADVGGSPYYVPPCYPVPVGFIDNCEVTPGGITFIGWAHDVRTLGAAAPPYADIRLVNGNAGAGAPLNAYANYVAAQIYPNNYRMFYTVLSYYNAWSTTGTPNIYWMGNTLDGLPYVDHSLGSYHIAMNYIFDSYDRLPQSVKNNYTVESYFSAVVNDTATRIPATGNFTNFRTSDQLFPVTLKQLNDGTVQSTINAYSTNFLAVLQNMVNTGFVSAADAYLDAADAPTNIDYNQAGITAYLASLSPPQNTPGANSFGFSAAFSLPAGWDPGNIIIDTSSRIVAFNDPTSYTLGLDGRFGSARRTTACRPPTWYDLVPDSIQPSLRDDDTGNSFVSYSHSITNLPTANENLSTRVNLRMHVTRGPGGPDLVAPVPATLDALAIGATTLPGTYISPPLGVNVGRLPPGTKVCTHITVTPATNKAGGPSTRSSYPPEHCATVTAKPFIKAYGAEVRAGGGFGSTCAPSVGTEGGIKTYGGLLGAGYRGASSQFGVMALRNINGFSSATLRGSNPVAPKGLTFANTDGSEFGGSFGSSLCMTDYYGTTQEPPAKQASYTSAASLVSGKKQYVLSGSTLGTTIIPTGSQAAIYVNGDLHINGDIIYTPGAGSIAAMPFLAVIVRGNIYIEPNVSRLDGLFVAQPSNPAAPVNGKIYTCYPPVGPPYTRTQLDIACNRQLVVNGGLVAQQIKFLRTNNTITEDTGQVPNFGTGTGTVAAEVVNSSPEMWLAPSPLVSTAGTGSASYDSLYSLPPVY